MISSFEYLPLSFFHKHSQAGAIEASPFVQSVMKLDCAMLAAGNFPLHVAATGLFFSGVEAADPGSLSQKKSGTAQALPERGPRARVQ